jgi:hypothetical protein
MADPWSAAPVASMCGVGWYKLRLPGRGKKGRRAGLERFRSAHPFTQSQRHFVKARRS